LCTYHTKLKYAFEDWVASRKRLGLEPLPWKHYVEMEEELHCDLRRLQCLEERCKECKECKLLEPFLLSVEKPESPTALSVQWRAAEKNDKGHLVINDKSGTPTIFIDHLKSVRKGFALHRFIVKNQASSLNSLVQDLQPGELFTSRDFSKKQELKLPEEIQT
jgi:hypothetical protein